MARLKDEYQDEIERFYCEQIEPIQKEDIPTEKVEDSNKYLGDDEPAF